MSRTTLSLVIFGLLLTCCRKYACEVRRSCKFDSVRLGDHFVDKSEIINVLFNQLSSGSRGLFLSNAHGFGNTVNLALIDMFANVEYNLDRHVVPAKESYAYSILKENFKVSQYESLIDEHLGQYLVIPLRLREFQQPEIIPKHVTWNLNMMISWSNRRWRWVSFHTKNFTTDNATSRIDFGFLQKFMRTKLRTHEVANSIEKFAEVMYRYLNKKIIIMVDDYDRVFRHAVQHTLKNVDLYYSLMNQALLPLLQPDNEKIYKVIITGTTSIPLYLSNCSIAALVDKYTFLQDHEFAPFYGLDDREVDELYSTFAIPIEEKAELESLANGYQTLTEHITKYNTDLVMAYFRRRRNLPDDDIVFNATAAQRRSEDDELYFPTPFLMVPPFRYKIIELIHKLDVELNLVTEYDEITFEKFATFKLYDWTDSENFSLDLLFTYIFEQGYLRLTNVPNKYHLPNRAALNDTWSALKIYYDDIAPQSLLEIADYFRKILLSENSTQIDEFRIELQTKLTNFFKQLTTDMDVFQQLSVPEYQFHSVIYAAILSSPELTINENEDELDAFGKSHIVFGTHSTSTKGVIEIKYGESAEQALELALSTFISDPKLTELKYIGVNVDQSFNTTTLVQLKPIQEHEHNPYQKR